MNLARKPIQRIIIFSLITTSVLSCEGFKVLTLHNKTGEEIAIETRPEIPRFKLTSLSDTSQNLSASQTYRLLPDSSISLLTSFGWLLFNTRIIEQNLPIDYLRIETSSNTILADGRSEIIKLIKDPRLKNKRTDKAFALDNNKNIEAIIVRK